MKKSMVIACFGFAVLLGLAKSHVGAPLFSANYLPHRFCYLAQPGLVWTNVVSDGLIAVSYAIIFSCLLWVAYRLRKVQRLKSYLWIFVAFGLFIAACGATHVMEMVTVWWPLYPLSAAIKVVCVAASVPTAILFARVAPTLARDIPGLIWSLAKMRAERDDARGDLTAATESAISHLQLEMELKVVNERLTHIMDSTSEGILKVAADWTMIYGNRRAKELLPDFAIGKDFWEAFPALISTDEGALLQRAMEERVEIEYEILYEPYQDWFRVNAFPTPSGLSLFFTPISAQKQLERQIETERAAAYEQMNSVMQSTAEGILKIGHDWTIVYGNRVAVEILPDLVMGKSYWECFPTIRGTESEEHLRKVMAGGDGVEWENYYEPYDEWYAVHAYPTEGGMSLFFIPITKRKKLEEQLEIERTLREKRIEALSVMAGGLAHEISNPLAIIHGTSSDLSRTAELGAPIDASVVRKAADSIAHTAERASRILRGLRGFAREAEHDPMEYASIYEIVEQAVQLQEARFERHQVELRLEIAAGIPLFMCRETQVGQILTNLINNSFDAITQQECPEHWVRVRASATGDSVELDVIDSGLGIDEEARKNLMNPFFSTKTRGLGMGVGLSLSRAIANEHGGSLMLCEGTTHTCFRLLLPIHKAESGSHPPVGVPDAA